MYIHAVCVCESEPASVCVIKRQRDLERLLKPVCLPEPLLVVRAAAKLSLAAHKLLLLLLSVAFLAACGFFYRRRTNVFANKTCGVMSRVWKLCTPESAGELMARRRLEPRYGSFDLLNPRAPRLCVLFFSPPG